MPSEAEHAGHDRDHQEEDQRPLSDRHRLAPTDAAASRRPQPARGHLLYSRQGQLPRGCMGTAEAKRRTGQAPNSAC